MRIVLLMVLAGASAASFVVASTAGSPEPRARAADEDVFTRTCATRAEGPNDHALEPRPGRDVVLGRAVVMGLRQTGPLYRPRRGDAIVKRPVLIRAGSDVTLRLRGLARTRARLDFDPGQWQVPERRIAAGQGQRAVRFESCPPGTQRFSDDGVVGEWTGYPGGFLVARRGCAILTATAPGEPAIRRRVALGVRESRCKR